MIPWKSALAAFILAAVPAHAPVISPGVYSVEGKMLYVGLEHELPDPAQNDFFDPATGRIGDFTATGAMHRQCGMNEMRRVVADGQGRIGASLYFSGETHRTTVVLVHGADPEAREMGFIIPYFVCNGVNVISYDQRGTGQSVGNWFLTSPVQKAGDVAAVYDAFAGDRHVDRHRIGVWGFSNGGWVAPLVTLRRPIAFMILKSAPTQSILSNLHYEVVQEMRRYHATAAEISQALDMWRSVERALFGKESWTDAARALAVARAKPWYKYSLMPLLHLPPTPAVAAGLRRALDYDPATTLSRVTTPTLALYGERDRKVDSADSALHLRRFLAAAGEHDVTIETFPAASHTLIVSANGYDPQPPERYVPQYPRIMLAWLARRGFTKRAMQ